MPVTRPVTVSAQLVRAVRAELADPLTPVLALGATGPMDSTQRRPWIDWIHTALVQGTLVRDYVKWDDQPHSLAGVPESLLRAYRIARTDPQGPIYVCYDAGLQEEVVRVPPVLPDPQRYAPPAPPQAHLRQG